ncbi:MAG: phosphoglycerate mutase family protein [Sphingomonas sp.]
MTGIRLAFAALLCALLPAAAVPADTAPPRYVMRHLDTPAGEPDPDLTAQGQARAQALVAWFAGKPLAAIYVSNYKRNRQTAAPLAAARGIAVTVYDPADTPALAARIKAEPGPVLVVGHANTVPDIVAQLGGERPAALTHPDFGDIWTIAGGETEHAKLP